MYKYLYRRNIIIGEDTANEKYEQRPLPDIPH